jgi:hypothetical protein
MVPRNVFGFPPKMMSRLRYIDTYTITSSVGSTGKQVIYINSTFDPDNTGTGHQPMYRDTYAALYDHYAVVSAKARVKFFNTEAAGLLACGVVIDDDNATVGLAVQTIRELSLGDSVVLPPLAGSLSTHTFTVEWDCKKILGIDPYSSEEYKTAVGSNPTEISALLLHVTNLAGGTASYGVDVELEQTVLWTELATAAGS